MTAYSAGLVVTQDVFANKKTGRHPTNNGWFVKNSVSANCLSDIPGLVIRRIFLKSGRQAEQKTPAAKMGKRRIV